MDESGHVLDDEQLRRSPAVSQVLERILDDVIPDSPPPRSRDAEARHRAAFTEAVRHLVDGLDPWFDLQGEHAVPPAARRGVRTLIRTMLGSLDIGRERRAVSTLVAAGMAVPTMCVLNRLLRADLDGHLEARRSSFLTELSLLHLGHLAENPLAGVAVLRWLDRRWSEWREELRSTPLLPPSEYQQGDEHLLWPTGEDLGAYLQSRHRLELIHTAVWALGDIKWDALADEEAREWLGERWKRGVVLLHDVATYGLTESEKGGYGEPAAGVFPTALSAVRQSAYYALAVTRWDEPQPGDSPARLEAIPVVGAVRQWYSHEDGQPVPHAHAIPGDARWPAEIAQHAVDIVDQLKHNGERPIVLEGLRAWRADYRKLVYPGPHQ